MIPQTKFERVAEDRATGTSLKGYMRCFYQDLVETFGPPTEFDGYKCDAHWALLFEGEVVATIYNYKDGPNYHGLRSDEARERFEGQQRDWHIGGRSAFAVELVRRALTEAGVPVEAEVAL
jgi:hypothetical protein